jgi:hypothetical protein
VMLCYNNGVFSRYQFKITNHHCILFTLESLLRSLLNCVQLCDRPPSNFTKTVHKHPCPNQRWNRQLQWPTTIWGVVHSDPKSKSSHKHVLWIPTLKRLIIYDLRPSHFITRKGPQAHNGWAPWLTAQIKSLFLPEIQTRSSSPQAVVLLTGMPL